MPLSADVGLAVPQDALSIAELVKQIDANDSFAVAELMQSIKKRNSSIDDTSQQPIQTLGDEPMVSFRIDLLDANGDAATDIEQDDVVTALVYVQDVAQRSALGTPGGVFQAVVDLQFSTNLHPIGDVTVHDNFNARPLGSTLDASMWRGVGGTHRQLIPVGQVEQLLLQTSFRVTDVSQPVRIGIIPSSSVPEPLLLYGVDVPIPSQNIVGEPIRLLVNPTTIEAGSLPDTVTPTEISPPVISTPRSAVEIPSDTSTSPDSSTISTTLVSFSLLPFSTFNPSDVFRIDQDWLRQPQIEPSHADDLEEWYEPDFSDLDARKTNDPKDPDLALEENESDRESEGETESEGLFYDETLFLEGAIVESFRSRFRLSLLLFDLNLNGDDDEANEQVAQRDDANQSAWIDIAAILRPPSQTPSQPRPSVDERERHPAKDKAIVDSETSSIDELLSVEMADLPFGRVEEQTKPPQLAELEQRTQSRATQPTPDPKEGT